MHSLHHYRHLLLALIAGTLMAGTSSAQDTETRDDDTSETAATAAQAEAAEATDDGDDEEEVIVDEGSYLDADDDDFKPSEEISADRSITFPTDI